jgi:hypothetical protein
MCSNLINTESLVSTTIKALKSADTAAAEKNIKVLISQEPHSACAQNLLGILAEIRGEKDIARRHYLAAYVFDGMYKPALRNLDRITSTQGGEGIDYGDIPEKEEPEENLYKIRYDKKHIGYIVLK